MQTRKIMYDEDGRVELVITDAEPDIVVSTDFEEIGIITTKLDNAGMMEAIEAVGWLSNCVVLKAERK